MLCWNRFFVPIVNIQCAPLQYMKEQNSFVWKFSHVSDMSRKRNSNSSETELQVLLDEVEKNKSEFFFSPTWYPTIAKNVCGNKHMQRKWSHQNCLRNKKKKPWYTSDTIKKIAQNRKESVRIGGGRAPLLSLRRYKRKFRGFWEIPPLMALKVGLIPQWAALAPLETEKFHVNAKFVYNLGHLTLLGYVLGQACRHLKVRTKIRKSPKIG